MHFKITPMIRNIIFDFGAVLIPIDEEKTWNGLKKLGANEKLALKNELFENYETGKISTAVFLDQMADNFFRRPFPDDIATQWNALLSPLPSENVKLLKKLRKKYRLFLVSNTNELHIKAIRQEAGPFLYKQFENQFEKIYYSFEVGMRKPDTQLFKKVLEENDLDPRETFYLDDGKEHLKSAKKLAIQTFYFDPESMNINEIENFMAEN